ncbi:cilia- and flagella-associated protein 47 isoform X2 [Tamandua tetradactyla]|uniref:cilia- and flagella-associated protein 47 isoform X2 n=1 Tax=Tamandua tetradactyla TaxID=48850 RepID=UPI00405417C4
MDRPTLETERGSLIPRDVEIVRKDAQLRVTPSEVKFLDAQVGKVYRHPITVHNLGRCNQKIRFQEPTKPQFKLIMTNLDKALASGLQMTAMVEYHPDKDEDTFDQLFISLGNKAIEIPLIGLIPACDLEIETEVDFGTLVANSKVYCKEVNLINHGRAPGMFKMEYQGQLPILIFPTNGTVKPKSSVIVKVDFCADEPRVVNEVATVKLQGRPDILLTIKAHVVEQIIELLNMSSGKRVDCIRFGSVFFGTSKMECALLYNNSPEPINWVAIMQDDSVGEELGTNVRQRTDIALNNLTYLSKTRNIDITTFITCVPNEGTLLPYQKTVITFCFSPKLIYDGKQDIDPSHRQDYAVFLRFESVGSKDGFLRDDDSKSIKSDRLQKVELALTGSGFPVLLHFDPGKVLNFTPCFMGERSEVLCVMQNRSKLLPVKYHFQKTAHFKIHPERGKIDEGCMQSVMCYFVPHQVGVFKVKQLVEIIGSVADENFQTSSMKPFYHVYLDFKSICKPFTKEVMMKINPGISPLVSNPTGQFVAKDSAKNNRAPVAMLQSAMTDIHNHHSNKLSMKDALIAFPNDRATSVRSGEQNKSFRTIFTKIPRYNYVDPDFAYTEFEKIEKRAHQNYYSDYIKYLRNVRLCKKAERKCTFSYNETDIGIQPGSGLKSPSLSEGEIEEDINSGEDEIKATRLLSTKRMASKEVESLGRKILEGLKSDPSTPQEKHDCSLILTSKQIHQVIVGPSVLNFGDVCVNSTSTHLLHIINMLSMHVLIQLDIDLEELQKTNQFSYVIPPTTSTYISVVFESPTIGKFWKSFTFTVNNIPSGHILVMAVILPVRLELSSDELVLKPQGFLVETCFRGTVRLYNRLNYFAPFRWELVNTEKKMAFSIRPATGIVEAYSSLECEVMWQPSFSSPEEGEFILHVDEGNTLKLKCAVHIGQTKVIFLEPRILFSNSPRGLTTWRKAILHNVGQNHAFFKVCDQSLLPTIDIVPSEGVIPLGGLTILNISCTPSVAEKFDTRAKIAIRRANTIDLRIGGSVETADVEINPNVFNFSGTYVGGTQIIPFKIKNKGITRAMMEFDLQVCRNFSMDFKGKSEVFIDPAVPYKYSLELEEKTSLECGLTFSPKEVAAQEFSLQVRVNFLVASKLRIQSDLSSSLFPKTAPLILPCYVQAAVLQAPLRLSGTEFVFEIPLHDFDPDKKVKKTQKLVLHNISKQEVHWTLDLSGATKVFKDGTFKFSELTGTLQPNEECTVSINFSPTLPKKYTADIPVRLNDNPVCYRVLCLTGEVKSPKLSLDPPFIFFNPVPLDVTTVMNINILPQNYFRSSTLHVKIPAVTLLDGDEIHPLSVKFPNGKEITGSLDGSNTVLICHLSFKSFRPVSFFTSVLFYDDQRNRFSLPVTATADNCILTIYPYMANYLDNQKIILKTDMDRGPGTTRDSFSLYYRDFGLSSPTSIKMTSSTIKFYDSEPTKERLFVGVETVPENLNLDTDETPGKGDDESVGQEEKIEQFFSPKEGTKAYNFYKKVVHAAQTWFSLFGWPQGPHSFSIPETIRRDVYKIQFYSSSSSKKVSRQSDFSKYNKTIYDVILHLSGKLPPGISSSQSLPVDDTERVKQLHLQHSSLLTFLDTQGACISHVLPEFLLEPEDYKKWIKITSSTVNEPVCSCTFEENQCVLTDITKFETLSKRAWTDVFLQIYKVLILSRVAPQENNHMCQFNVEKTSKINPYFSSSNIYSYSERILLSWMNTNYETSRHVVWKNCHTGVVPSERWIVNFDKDLSDGLVFATQLAVYCSFLIDSHFVNMYTQPKSPEQYLHNCLIIVNALHEIGFDIEIQATEICDPNPILMLMLCVYMYERLPTYLPKKVVPFHCTLHGTVLGQILLKNSSLKTLVYNAAIVGRDAADFSLAQQGSVVTIAPKNQNTITVKFTSRFLHPAEASLLLISKTKNATGGTTMTFALKGEVLSFKAVEIIKCETPCYQWKEVTVNINNPFHSSGNFNVILVESSTFVYLPSQVSDPGQLVHPTDHRDSVSSYDCDFPESCPPPPDALKTSIKAKFIKEFFCSVDSLYLETKGNSTLELCFLPFNIHTRYCAIILSNQKIGELIYIVEGRSMIPLPSSFVPVISSTPADYSSSPEEMLTEENPVLYFKCKLRQILEIELKLPVTNIAKEKALALAAQRQMSDIEYQRRLITGTLESSSVRVAIAILGLTRIETYILFNISKLKKPKFISYTTEVSLPEHFAIPEKIYVPQIPESQTKSPQSKIIPPSNKPALFGAVPFPLRFVPLSPGRYPCKILLTSKYDVRVYCVEGIVNEDHPEAKFEFKTPAFGTLTQNIPINNTTETEWKFQVTIQGQWFYGPSILYVESGETVLYPLTFKPILECDIMGKLILKNEVDGMEHIFEIRGIGTKPLALEHITMNCQVGKVTNKSITIPSYSRDIFTYKVNSDLPMVWGKPKITIDPENAIPYVIHVCPWKRGLFKGAISFTVKSRGPSDSLEEIEQEDFFQKSLSEMSQHFDEEDSDDGLNNLKIWYCLEINSSPASPISIIEMTCFALETACIDIPLSNPKYRSIHFDVQLTDAALKGLTEFILNPLECVNYVVQYSPATAGCRDESIIFQPEMALEFWYLLRLTVEVPKPTIMPEVQCKLGEYTTQTISLFNPTHETLELQATNNNPGNFVLDIDGKSPFEEWRFLLSGVGLFPQPLDTQRITTYLGLHSSVVIFFKNPTEEDVFIDVTLTSQETPKDLVIDPCWNSFFEENSAFRFKTLNQVQGIPLSPKGNIDIPMLFIPSVMKLYKTLVVIQLMRANGENWPIDNFDELDAETKRAMGISSGEMRSIHWIYPIVGLPQAPPPESPQAVIKCQARKRVEQVVEVTMTGVFFEQSPTSDITDFVVIPRRGSDCIYEDIYGAVNQNQVSSMAEVPSTREFQYEILFESEAVKSHLESCVALYLIKKTCDFKAEMITLTFNVIFTPTKPMWTDIILKLESVTDGIWTFPITLIATEPDIDDVIDIEGIGLFKESFMDFRLTSQKRNPAPFTAYFLPGSDPEFSVKPQIGELLPFNTKGTLIKVGFRPQMYSRKYKATLVIQTEDMYWLYDINGLPQVTMPPQNVKAKIDTNNKLFDCKPVVPPRNFIRENAKLIRTGVSSTIKGAPLMLKNK